MKHGMEHWLGKRGTTENGYYYLSVDDEVIETDEFMGSHCDGTWRKVSDMTLCKFFRHGLSEGFLGTYRRKVVNGGTK